MEQRKYIFSAVLISSFMCPFLSVAINVSIPAMAAEFQKSAIELSWAVTAFLMGSASVLLPCGRLADIIGRKKMFQTGTAAVGFVSLVCGLAANESMLIAARFAQGLSIAMIFVTGMAMLVSSHHPKERGRVIGCSVAATYSGLSLGPFLGGFITHYASWRLIFFLSAAVLTVSWQLSRRITAEWRGAPDGRFNYVGSLLYFVASLAFMYGLSVYATSPKAPLLIIGGIWMGMAFLLEEYRSESPLLDFSLFRNVIFAMSNVAALLHYSATFAISFLMSLHLQVLRNLDEITAGSILLLQPMMMAMLSPMAGRLSDKIEPRIVASIGMTMTALGIFALACLSVETPLYLVCITLLFIGMGFALFSSPNASAIMGAVSPQKFGLASSVMSMMRIFGQSMSMVLVTLLMSASVMPAVDPSYFRSLETGIQNIFSLFSIICVVGVFVSLLRGNRQKDDA